jgi:nuclear GTP-binding protein
VESWLTTLRKEYPTVAFHSASSYFGISELKGPDSKGKGKEEGVDELGVDAFSECLAFWSKDSSIPLTVTLVGFPNVSFDSCFFTVK